MEMADALLPVGPPMIGFFPAAFPDAAAMAFKEDPLVLLEMEAEAGRDESKAPKLKGSEKALLAAGAGAGAAGTLLLLEGVVVVELEKAPKAKGSAAKPAPAGAVDVAIVLFVVVKEEEGPKASKEFTAGAGGCC